MKHSPKLDRIDFEIIAALQNNARLSNKELAAQVDLAPSTCLERVKRLRQEKVLQGFHATVDPEMMGVELQALLSIRIRRHSRKLIEQFYRHVISLRESVAVYHVAGANDLIVHVAVQDVEHLRNLVLDAFTARPEVEHMETALIFGHMQKPAFPNYVLTGVSRKSAKA